MTSLIYFSKERHKLFRKNWCKGAISLAVNAIKIVAARYVLYDYMLMLDTSCIPVQCCFFNHVFPDC